MVALRQAGHKGAGWGRIGGMAGTAGTSGGAAGTSGGLSRDALAYLGLVTLSLVGNIVNVLSIRADRIESGLPPLGWQLWLWEGSSWVGFLFVLPFARRAARAFRPPRLPWAAAPLAHLPVAMLFSAGHVAIMLAIRQLGYAWMGLTYDFFGSSPAGMLIYEFRKDIVVYAASVAVFLLVGSGSETPSAPRERITVRDGTRTLYLRPDEIVSVEAAANYVELATTAGTVLHRTTLAAMEAELGDGFARVHRSRLVRRDAVREVRGTPSGDFELVLEDGRTVAGSRRYRDRLQL